MKVIVVGGGIAGLTCAGLLLRRGIDVLLLEASDGVGGRVRTDVIDGFRLDRGFQVLFTAYPAARRNLNMKALHLRAFDPGAIIALNGRRYILSDPTRDPASFIASALAPVITPLDKVLTALLAAQLRLQSVDRVLKGRDTTTERYLQRRGFSRSYIEHFVRPFYGGVFLDRSLNTSSKCFKFDFKMLTQGVAAVPAHGMGAISAQLAAPLEKRGLVRLNTGVSSLNRAENGAVTGVTLSDGSSMAADKVVLSVPAPEAARLTGQKMPKGRTSTVNVYWGGDKPVYHGKKLVLNANPIPFVDNAVQITNAAPEYAPSGKHLLSASVIGLPELDEESIVGIAMDDLLRMFRGDPDALSALDTYRPLKVYRIPYGQFAQPPGIHPRLPDNRTPIQNLLFAAEFTEASSQNAAMISAEKAADLILTGA